MIEGFVTTYIDDEEWVHLFFYPGIDDDDKPIFNDIDMSKCGVRFDVSSFVDNSKDFKLLNKNIIKVNCKLVTHHGDIIKKTCMIDK